jgi:sugar phosphate permease
MLGLLAGLTQALGMLGAAAGEAPVSFLASVLGWRNSMLMMAMIFVVLSLFIYQFVQDRPKDGQTATKKQEAVSIVESLALVLSHKGTWVNALYAGFLFAPVAVIGEAIGPAYLQYAHGISQHAAAFAVGLIFIGWGVSGPLTGWASDRIGKRKPFMIVSALLGLLITMWLVFYPTISTTTAYWLFFLFGATNTGVAISYAVATEIQPSKVVGTSLAFTNMVSILIGAMMQPIVGHLIDAVAGGRAYNVQLLALEDFQAGLKILPLSSFLAFVFAIFIKETHCCALQVKTRR